MSKQVKAIACTILAALAVALAGCGGNEGAEATTIKVVTNPGFAFSSPEIRLKQGVPVQLVLENADASEHDFTIDEMPVKNVKSQSGGAGQAHGEHEKDYAVHVAAGPGETGTVAFTPSQAGRNTYYCSVPGHRALGMVGTLIVEG